MAEHTPGPWTVDGTKALGAYGVWTDYAHPNNPGHDGTGYQAEICSVYMSGAMNHLIGKEERNANARLIAAAPDLLAACKLWDKGFVDGEDFTHEQFLKWVNDNRRAARAAVAKAEGGQS